MEDLLLGRAALAVEPADPARARRHLDAAVAGLRRAGDAEFIARGLLERAASHRRSGDLDLAAADLAEARGIAARGGMRLHLVDADLEAARLALARGETEAARGAYASAREGVRAVRYHRRDGALDEMARALGEATPGWLHEADVMVELPPSPPSPEAAELAIPAELRQLAQALGIDLRELAKRLGVDVPE